MFGTSGGGAGGFGASSAVRGSSFGGGGTSPAGGGGGFGQPPAAAAGGFGTPSAGGFGANGGTGGFGSNPPGGATGGFNQPAAAASATGFGGNGFGGGASNGGFGASNGAANGGFGASNGAAGGGFGASNGAAGGGFGASNGAAGGGFGASKAAANGGFGASKAAAGGGFGASKAAAGGGFGTAGGTGGFNASNNGHSGFGEAMVPSQSGFGKQPSATGGFGQSNAGGTGGFGKPSASGFGAGAGAAAGFGTGSAAAANDTKGAGFGTAAGFGTENTQGFGGNSAFGKPAAGGAGFEAAAGAGFGRQAAADGGGGFPKTKRDTSGFGASPVSGFGAAGGFGAQAAQDSAAGTGFGDALNGEGSANGARFGKDAKGGGFGQNAGGSAFGGLGDGSKGKGSSTGKGQKGQKGGRSSWRAEDADGGGVIMEPDGAAGGNAPAAVKPASNRTPDFFIKVLTEAPMSEALPAMKAEYAKLGTCNVKIMAGGDGQADTFVAVKYLDSSLSEQAKLVGNAFTTSGKPIKMRVMQKSKKSQSPPPAAADNARKLAVQSRLGRKSPTPQADGGKGSGGKGDGGKGGKSTVCRFDGRCERYPDCYYQHPVQAAAVSKDAKQSLAPALPNVPLSLADMPSLSQSNSNTSAFGAGGAPPSFIGGKPKARRSLADMPALPDTTADKPAFGAGGAPPSFIGGKASSKLSLGDMPALPGSPSRGSSPLFGGTAKPRTGPPAMSSKPNLPIPAASFPSSGAPDARRKKRRPPESFGSANATASGGIFGNSPKSVPDQASLYVSSPVRSVPDSVRSSIMTPPAKQSPKPVLRAKSTRLAKPDGGVQLLEETVETEWGRMSSHAAAILEKRSKSSPPLFFGTCTMMISPQELEKRQTERLGTATFEVDETGNLRGSQYWIAENSRGAVGAKKKLPTEVRTLKALEDTMNYLGKKICEADVQGFEGMKVNYLQAYDFIDNRYRQIRRELMIQGLVYTPESIRFHEQMIRFQLMSVYRLCWCFPDPNSPLKMREEEKKILKCMVTLFPAYSDQSLPAYAKVYEAEFKAYFVLLKTKELLKPGRNNAASEIAKYMRTSSPQVLAHPVFKIAWRVYESLGGSWPQAHRTPKDFVTFFRILKSDDTPFIFACLMHGLVDDMRKEAYRIMHQTTLAEKGFFAAPEAYALDKFVDTLAFDGVEEALDWCEFYSVQVLKAEEYVKMVEPQLRDVLPKIGHNWDDFAAKALAKQTVITIGKSKGVVVPNYEEVCSKKEQGAPVVEPHVCEIVTMKREGVTAWELVSGACGTGIVIDKEAMAAQQAAREAALASFKAKEKEKEEIRRKQQVIDRQNKLKREKELKVQRDKDTETERQRQIIADQELREKKADADRKQREIDAQLAQQKAKQLALQKRRDEEERKKLLQQQQEDAKKAKELADQRRREQEARETIIRQKEEADRKAKAAAAEQLQREEARIRKEREKAAAEQKQKREEEEQAEQKRADASRDRRNSRHNRMDALPPVECSPLLPESDIAELTIWGAGNEFSKRPRREVIQSVATVLDVSAHLMERNPHSEVLFWRFVVFGEARSEPFSALQWVSTRMQRIPTKLSDATTSSARVLCDYSVQLADEGDRHRKQADLRIRGSQVTVTDGGNTAECEIFQTEADCCQALLFVCDGTFTGTEAVTLQRMASAIPASTHVPLLVIVVKSKSATIAADVDESLQLSRLRELYPAITATHTVTIERDCWGEESSPAMSLDHAVSWLASHSPPQPRLQCHASLADALQDRLDKFWVVPSCASPVYCIGLYNSIVIDLARDLRASESIAWPIPDFDSEDLEVRVGWNDIQAIAPLVAALQEMLLSDKFWVYDDMINESVGFNTDQTMYWWLAVIAYLKQEPHPTNQETLAGALHAIVSAQLALGHAPADARVGGCLWYAVFSEIIECRVHLLRETSSATVYMDQSCGSKAPSYDPPSDTLRIARTAEPPLNQLLAAGGTDGLEIVSVEDVDELSAAEQKDVEMGDVHSWCPDGDGLLGKMSRFEDGVHDLDAENNAFREQLRNVHAQGKRQKAAHPQPQAPMIAASASGGQCVDDLLEMMRGMREDVDFSKIVARSC